METQVKTSPILLAKMKYIRNICWGNSISLPHNSLWNSTCGLSPCPSSSTLQERTVVWLWGRNLNVLGWYHLNSLPQAGSTPVVDWHPSYYVRPIYLIRRESISKTVWLNYIEANHRIQLFSWPLEISTCVAPIPITLLVQNLGTVERNVYCFLHPPPRKKRKENYIHGYM